MKELSSKTKQLLVQSLKDSEVRYRRLFEAAQDELSARARLSFARNARIEPAALGAEGPLIGAAALAYEAINAKLFAATNREER